MASTYSDLKIELIGTGEQTGTWGTTTNNNFSVAVGEAITGSADVAFSSSDVTLTLTDTNAAQTARNLRLNLTGTSGGARNLILGSGCQIEKLYLINNGLADAVTVKNTSGTGIAVPAGKTMFVYNNGTNVVDAVTHLTSLTTGTLSASGVATFSAGTVSAPAITTTGDTNTGIFFPAADTIAFTEGGVESMRIDVSGNVGIGVTPGPWSAYKALQVGLNTSLAGNTSGSAALFSSNALFDGSSFKYITTDAASQYQQNTGEHIWRTAASGSAGATLTFSERMRIDSSGNVGIGTSTPGSFGKLVVKTSSTSEAAGLAVMSSTNDSFLTIYNSGSVHNIGATYSSTGSYQPIAFVTSGSERMRIDSSGNVGIGTSSPSAKLQVNQTTSSGSAIFVVASSASTTLTSDFGSLSLQNTNTTNGNYNILGFANDQGGFSSSIIGVYTSHTSGAQSGELAFFTRSAGNYAERMRITSIGFLKASNTGTYFSATGEYHELRSNQNTNIAIFENTQSIGNVYGPYIAFTGQNPNNTTSYFLQCAASGEKATIRSNGGIANFSANDVNLSDRREKTNFAPAKSYLDTICSIPVQTFNYIDQNMEEDGGLTLGVVAQDVQAVAPELVMESNWAGKDQPEKMRLSIYQTDLQYALMKSIQELKAELDSVKAELQTLKGN